MSLTPRIDDIETNQVYKFQLDYMAGDVDADDGPHDLHAYTGLDDSKYYRVTAHYVYSANVSNLNLHIYTGTSSTGSVVARSYVGNGNAVDRAQTVTLIMQATGGVITFYKTDGGSNVGYILGNGTDETFFMIEELPAHTETSEW